jgi:carbon storage regulator
MDVAMLVLSRKVGQRILIGDKIAVTVVRVAQGTVRIGIEAPRDMPVVREEIQETLVDQRVALASRQCLGPEHGQDARATRREKAV